MKRRILKYLLVIFLVLTGTGCEKYVNFVDPPDFRQKIVVTSFISPSDTVSRIYVTSNQQLYGYFNEPEDPGEISGTISDGTTEIELDTTSSGLSFTRDDMPVIYGKTYTLRISGSKGLYAEAVTTVPQKREILTKLDTASRDIYEFLPGNELMVTLELTDFPGERNFYNVIGKFTGYKTDQGSEESSFYPRFWFEYLDDIQANSENKIRLESWIVESANSYDSAFMTVYLLNTAESYYLYHTSMYEYEHSDNILSEAKPVYSNISGGLGIFTSYTIDSLIFRLK
jgi:hypothetical protein